MFSGAESRGLTKQRLHPALLPVKAVVQANPVLYRISVFVAWTVMDCWTGDLGDGELLIRTPSMPASRVSEIIRTCCAGTGRLEDPLWQLGSRYVKLYRGCHRVLRENSLLQDESA
eukprot:s122_g25.t1